MPSSLATSACGLSLVRASSTARWRNSAGSGAGMSNILPRGHEWPQARCPDYGVKLTRMSYLWEDGIRAYIRKLDPRSSASNKVGYVGNSSDRIPPLPILCIIAGWRSSTN